MPDDGIKCESFTAISVDSLSVYNGKYYLKVYSDKCACKIIGKQMIDYLDDNPFNAEDN